jgi:hypothetical protein
MSIRIWTILGILSTGLASVWAGDLSADQQHLLAGAKRSAKAGWIYLHIEGDAATRGFQHGYLLAPEIREELRIHRKAWTHRSGMTWEWLVSRSAQLMTPKVDAEDLEEIDGIVAGLRAAGVASSRDEIVAYNAQLEFEEWEDQDAEDPPGKPWRN